MSGIDLFSRDGLAPPVTTHRRNAGGVTSAENGPLANVPVLPAGLHLGTSSWSFPGWKGIVYQGAHAEAALSRHGLAAYAGHRLLKTVSIDRTFYAAIDAAAYRHYAMQVPDGFRFLVKAPAAVADAALRGEDGRVLGENAAFLDPALAFDIFIGPCIEGLAGKAGPLVFQIPPMAAAVACAIAAVRTSGRERTGWALFAMGVACWSAGEWIWASYDLLFQAEVPLFSIADPVYYAGYVLLAGGLILLVVPERDASITAKSLFDALLLIAVLAVVSWRWLLACVM